MATASPPPKGYDIFRQDRPGWIPEWVGDDWNPNPYAYQTREQLMPAGRFHGLYLQILTEMLRPLLQRLGLYLLIDVFVFYRDWEGRKQRIAPDALVAPTFTELTEEQAARSYDLDVEPLPLCVIELTSPKSHASDQQGKPFAYALLGIKEYLLLDIVDAEGHLLPQIGVTLWRLNGEHYSTVAPDAEGYVVLETLPVRLRADGRQLVAQATDTGELLLDATQLVDALAEAAQRAALEARVRQEAEQRATQEAEARQQAEAELARLRAELERLRADQ